MSQVRNKNPPEKELNKMEISNLLCADFKTLATRMVNELCENFNSIKRTSQK